MGFHLRIEPFRELQEGTGFRSRAWFGFGSQHMHRVRRTTHTSIRYHSDRDAVLFVPFCCPRRRFVTGQPSSTVELG